MNFLLKKSYAARQYLSVQFVHLSGFVSDIKSGGRKISLVSSDRFAELGESSRSPCGLDFCVGRYDMGERSRIAVQILLDRGCETRWVVLFGDERELHSRSEHEGLTTRMSTYSCTRSRSSSGTRPSSVAAAMAKSS